MDPYARVCSVGADGDDSAYPEGVILAEGCNKIVGCIGGRGSAFASDYFVTGEGGVDFRRSSRRNCVIAG